MLRVSPYIYEPVGALANGRSFATGSIMQSMR